jgi:hypothetical protein
MKLILVALISLGLFGINAAPSARAADKEDGPPGWKKSGHVPPGLAKKGGVPPGQAKKHGNAGEEEEADAAPSASKPAAPAPAPTPAPAPAPAPPTPTPKPALPDAPKAPETAKAPGGTVTTPAPATRPAQSAKAPSTASPTGREKREALDRKVKELNALGSNPTERAAIMQKTSKALDIPIATLQAQQKNHPELRPGGLYMANAIAKKSKKPAGQVINQHLRENKSWSEIAREHNVNLDRLLEESTVLERAVRG